MDAFKTFVQNFVKQEEKSGKVLLEDKIGSLEVIIVIQNVQIVDNTLVGDIFSGKRDQSVKNRESIPQGTISFLGDQVQPFRVCCNAFGLGHISQVMGNVFNRDALKIKDLAAAKYGWDDLVLFCSSQDKDGMRRWFFKRF